MLAEIGTGDKVHVITDIMEVIQLAAAPSIVYSLYFDGSGDEVDCGNNASIMDLHAGAAGFTVDAYYMCPDMAGVPNGMIMGIASQGRWAEQGWVLMIQKQTAIRGFFYFSIDDGGGVWQSVFQAIVLPATGTWFYLRGRRDAGPGAIHLSVDAGAEANQAAVGANLSADPFKIGHSHVVGVHWGYGNLTYVHLWNADQGALGAVPNTPFALGANTAARYRFTDGAGAVLTDDSGNGNNGNIINAVWQQVGPAGWTP